jgi:hypothetical protein
MTLSASRVGESGGGSALADSGGGSANALACARIPHVTLKVHTSHAHHLVGRVGECGHLGIGLVMAHMT